MPRTVVTTKSYSSGPRAYKIAAARAAVRRSALLLRARSRRLRSRNIRTGGFLGIEKKFYDTSANGALVSDATMVTTRADPATVLCISAPEQGDGESQRDGKKIKIVSAHVHGSIVVPVQANQTAADNMPKVMVALVLDTQSNGAQLKAEDVFTNPSAQATTCIVPLRNLQYSKRFKVLATKLIQPPTPTMAFDGTNIEVNGTIATFKINKKLNLDVNFTGTTAGIANVVDNSLHIIAVANSIASNPTLTYNARVRFIG